MGIYEELKERGLIYQTTDEEELKRLLNETNCPVYTGTDPTADSLHIGHCVPACIMRKLQKAGHKVIILVGGATAAIGDPTGKTEMRQMLTEEQLNHNIESIKQAYSKFLDFNGNNPAIMVNNGDWFKNLTYVDFMREIGVHFNVNKMVSNEIYAKRMEEGGLTFFEMGYMPMQAYDFIHLNNEYGCLIEWGGADQWGNIVAGTELARKLNFKDKKERNLVGVTNPLLLTPEGKKMGKTEKGAIWIDNNKISAYDFYQGIYQIPDACVEMMYAIFTEDNMEEVRTIIKEDIIKAKKRLAFEITKFIRNEEDALLAQKTSEEVFNKGGVSDTMPSIELSKESITSSINILDLLVQTNIAPSKSEARRLVIQNGIKINNEVEANPNKMLTEENLTDGYITIQKGKKTYLKVIFK